jgi:mannose-6-phosphate isomerase
VSVSPSRLAPVFVPRIWGSRSLAPFFDSALAASEPIGEVWLTGDSCAFASGPFRGRALGEAWPYLPPEWTGTLLRGRPRIPLLVKFIFPEQKLSVQVHPNNEYARRNEAAAGGTGKTEMWYAVEARPDAELRLGLEPDVTPEGLRQALAGADVERCLSRLSVKAGDAFFVPAGTAHTIGPGMLLCEVQQHSDITYRVFDFNRKNFDGSMRPLHISQAMEVMRFGPQHCGKLPGIQIQTGSLQRTYLAACSHFATEIWEFAETIDAKTCPERFEILVFLSGVGRIRWGSQSMPFNSGEAWMLPATVGNYQLITASSTKLLRTYVPDLEQLPREFAAEGLDELQLSAILRQ